jgi:glycosyltransferase involved in cell wall biosynthesis
MGHSVKLDFVGHFGTTLSFARLSAEICRALRADGKLGRVTNLDDEWHEANMDLCDDAAPTGTHCFIATEPRHYFESYLDAYEARRIALYSSPNTNTVGKEHAQLVSKVGKVFVPSGWCEESIRNGCESNGAPKPDNITVVPLGVADGFSWSDERYARLSGRARSGKPWTAVHLSSDHAWPGRKGTGELLSAWAMMPRDKERQLIVHAPRAIYEDVFYKCADLGISDQVEILMPPLRGSSDAELLEVMEQADTIILPTRCEGFGMIVLSALCLGIPTIATCETAHAEFMGSFGGWLAAPASPGGEMAYEEGSVPEINIGALADAMLVAEVPESRLRLLQSAKVTKDISSSWQWSHVAERWVSAVCGWMEETS